MCIIQPAWRTSKASSYREIFLGVVLWHSTSHTTNTQCFRILVFQINQKVAFYMLNKSIHDWIRKNIFTQEITVHFVNNTSKTVNFPDSGYNCHTLGMRRSPRSSLPMFFCETFPHFTQSKGGVSKKHSSLVSWLPDLSSRQHGNYWQVFKASLPDQIARFDLSIVLCK